MQRPCGHLLSNLSTQRLTWLTNCLWLLSVHTEEIIHSQFSHLCHHIHSLWSLFGLGVSLPVDLHLKCVKSLRSMSNSGLYFDRKKTYTLYLTTICDEITSRSVLFCQSCHCFTGWYAKTTISSSGVMIHWSDILIILTMAEFMISANKLNFITVCLTGELQP